MLDTPSYSALALLTARSLAVEDMGCGRDHTRRPAYLRLKGQWLREAGFTPGTRVRITVTGPGRLEITCTEPGMQARLAAAIAATRGN